MPKTIQARKLFDFAEIFGNLALRGISIDWNGDPIMLFDEGRPAFPVGVAANKQRADWFKVVPVAHHVARYREGRVEQYRFPNDAGSVLTSFAQPFADGWLLVDARGGAARIWNSEGKIAETLNLGDAINHVQTTQNRHIWVSYFDEGIFGGGIGQHGLVCFDNECTPLFKFAEFASAANLPPIDDCYALNVCSDRVWTTYYSTFPIVCLKDFKLHRHEPQGFSSNAFAVRGEAFLFACFRNAYKICSLTLGCNAIEEFDPIDEDGTCLSNFQNSSFQNFAQEPETLCYYRPFETTARGSRFYLYTEKSLYELPI